MKPEELDRMAEKITANKNIKRKFLLFDIMDTVTESGTAGIGVVGGMGEDSAAISAEAFIDSDGNPSDFLILLTTDAIEEKFAVKNPESAGYSSILVCMDDIFACGGTPIAASCIIGAPEKETLGKIMKGILRASRQFGIPIVRGHTADCATVTSVSATMIGKIRKKHYISAGGAREGDMLMLISDHEGRIPPAGKYYWDTVSFKSGEDVLYKRKCMNELAESGSVDASKDVSNGGIFGTLLLMMHHSEKGCEVYPEKIEMPAPLIKKGYSPEEFFKMYLTTAFILAVPPEKTDTVKQIADKYGMHSCIFGKVRPTLKIELVSNNRRKILFEVPRKIPK